MSGHLVGRLARACAWVVSGLSATLLAAAAVAAMLDAVDRRRVRPPGELVELADGRRLHVHVLRPSDAATSGAAVTGAAARCTVVLEAGSGGCAATMAWLHRDLAAHSTVVAYDRAGYGFSDPADHPLDATSVAADLHDALQHLGLPGPYVLVGHSLGGAYVRVFAARYPHEVAALVLLDPVHEEQLTRQPTEATEQLERAKQQLAVAPLLARLGVFRLLDVQSDLVAALPEDAGAQHRARSITPTGLRAYGREVAAMPDLLDELGHVEHVSTTAPFGGLPVLVISATRPGDGETPAARDALDTLHRELADRSPTATRAVIPGADHLGLVTDPDHAQQVATSITRFLDTLDSLPARDARRPGS